MKRSFLPISLSFVVCFSVFNAAAQVGIGTETPSDKAVLELKSPGNNQGFLVPRLSTAQRTAISGLGALEKGLLVFDTNTDKFYYWSGTAWIVIEDSTGTDSQTLSYNPGTGLLTITGGNNVTITGTIPGGTAGGDLTGTYPNPTVASGAITSAKILDGTIGTADLANTSVTDAKIANGVTVGKLSPGTNGQVLLTSGTTPTWSTIPPPSGTAGGDLTGTYPNPTVANNAITSAKILDGTVATADLADGSVTSAKVLDGTITNTDINASAAIAVTKVAPGTNGQVLSTSGGVATWTTPASGGTVTNIATGAGLTGGPITTTGTVSLADGGVTTVKLADGSVTTAKILDGTVATADLADGSVTSAKVLDGTITNTDINPTAAIAVTKVAPGTNGQVLLTSGTTPTWSTMPPPSGTASGDLTGTYPGPTVANNAITSVKILDGTVATADLADGSVTSAKVLDGTITNTDINATAAIAVTKVAPGTNGQVLLTSGTTPTWSTMPPPSGTASGDLTGTYPGPTVANNAITSVKILDGTVATTDLADGSVTSAKVLDGTITNTDINATAAIAVTKVAPGTNGQVLLTSGTTPTWSTMPPPSGTAGGDLTGTYPDPTVANNAITSVKILDGTVATADLADGSVTSAKVLDGTITNTDINATAAIAVTKVAPGTNGQVLLTSGTTPTWSTMPPPSGTASGDLNGIYPNPTVDGLQGRTVASTAPVDGQVLKWNGTATAWTPAADNSSAFTLPYAATSSAASTLFEITQDGTAQRAARFNVTNASNNSPALSTTTTGGGFSLVGGGVNFGVGGTATAQGGVGGYFANSADRGNGAFGWLNTTTTPSFGVLGYSYIIDATVFGAGVYGEGKHYGVRATGGNSGGYFENSSGQFTTILAGNGAAVWARSDEASGTGIRGIGGGTTSTGVYGTGTSAGVYGISDVDGVYGYTFSTGATGYAVYGIHPSTSGTAAAIRGETNSQVGSATAITGVVTSTAPGGNSTGVRGINNGTGGLGIGVWGSHAGSGYGVYGTASTGGFAVRGFNSDVTTGYAGYFQGRLHITGALSKGSGTFKIDHPLDPANKFLYHSFVESPDMKNIYDGVVTLDANGQAEITLPEWFGALNKDFRYQLTCIGGFSQVYISKEVTNNSFGIAGGSPGMKVSWQLTGIRKDPYAEKNRVVVEENKTGEERGKYLYPDAYGLPASMGIGYSQQQTQGVLLEQNESKQDKLSIEQIRQRNEQAIKDPNPSKVKDKGIVKPPKFD